MRSLQEEHLVGRPYFEAVTTLLQRTRSAHPTKGSYQAAEPQWWWRVPDVTDEFRQLFWFDDLGRPEAAVIITDWGAGHSALYEEMTMVVIVMPDATPTSGRGSVRSPRAIGCSVAATTRHGHTTWPHGAGPTWSSASCRHRSIVPISIC